MPRSSAGRSGAAMIASEEIKTLHLGVNEVRDQDILCNLDSLGDDVRSLFGQTLLLSARPLTPPVLERAAHERIAVLGAPAAGPARVPGAASPLDVRGLRTGCPPQPWRPDGYHPREGI